MPMMTLTGAFSTLGAFCAEQHSASFVFAASLVHQISRAGSWLAEVGPHFIKSQIACKSLSATAWSVYPLKVRAVRNSWSSDASGNTVIKRLALR